MSAQLPPEQDLAVAAPNDDIAQSAPFDGDTIAPEDAGGGADGSVNRVTSALAAGIASGAAAWMVSGMFRDFTAHLVALGGAALGTAIVVMSYRIRRGAWLQYTIIPAALLLALILVAPDARGGSSGFVQLVVDAVKNGGLLQPPIPFDPGWRAILVVVFALLAGTSAALGAGFRRPKLGVLIPLPLAMGSAIVQPASTEVVSVAVALVMVVLALTLAYGAALGGGPGRSVAFEVRRMMRGGAIATGVAVLVVGLSSFGFLFPQPNQQRIVPPQRPQLPPPEPDRVLFSYTASRPVPLRLGTIDVYDVVQRAWLLPPIDASRLKRLNPPTNISLPGGVKYKPSDSDIKVTITVADATGHALPDVAGLVRLQSQGNVFGYDPRTGGLTLADKPVYRGLRYTLVGTPLPNGTDLAAAPKADKSFQQYLAAPPPPPQVTALLTQYSERSIQQGVPEDQWNRLQFLRQALYNKVVASGAGRPVDLPASRVAQMLDGGEASPYEIVAAEALLARWANVPSRIGFGYYGGDRQADGSFNVHPVHGAMWIEVYYPGHGWLPVIGVPPKAKPSTSQAQKNQVNIPSTNLGQLIVYIPIRVPTFLPFFQVVRYWLARVVPVVALVFALVAAYPWAMKAARRGRRRAWASRHGLRGRIAVAYVEFRDLARDLTIGDPGASPVAFLRHVAPDPEHQELAWLVTRSLWGDLRRDLRPEDALAAERLARSVGSRLDRAQGGLTRLLGRVARTSLRAPYSLDVPNLWWEPRLHMDWRSSLRFLRRRRARVGRPPVAIAAGIMTLLLASCGTSASAKVAARKLPSRLVPDKVGAFTFQFEPGPSKQYGAAGADALVSTGKVYSIHQADATDGAVETALFKPDVNVDDINDESQIRHCFEVPEDCQGHEVVTGLQKNLGAGHFQRLYYRDQRAYSMQLSDQRIYLWFPPHRQTMVMLILLSQFDAQGGDAMFHAVLDFEQGREPGAVPIPSIAPASPVPSPGASPQGAGIQLPAGLLPSAPGSPGPSSSPSPSPSGGAQ